MITDLHEMFSVCSHNPSNVIINVNECSCAKMASNTLGKFIFRKMYLLAGIKLNKR